MGRSGVGLRIEVKQMAKDGEVGRTIVVDSRVEEDEPEVRLLMPTVVQGPFLPFERFADTTETKRTQVGLHPHEAEEVVGYVVEGYVHHEDGEGHHADLSEGSVLVAEAHREIRHELTAQPREGGRRARWLSIVLRMPWHTQAPPTSIEIKEAGDVVRSDDGTTRRAVVGPLARADSVMGLECTDLCFTNSSDVSFQVGRGRRGIAYVMAASGSIEKAPVAAGQAVLFENLRSLAVRGPSGFRVFIATVPTSGSDESYPSGERFQGARFPGGRGRSDPSAPTREDPTRRSK
jgi:redox-sensitive bicupin YhaK (pirin superfamily)